jgi:hypothetical protein
VVPEATDKQVRSTTFAAAVPAVLPGAEVEETVGMETRGEMAALAEREVMVVL